MAERCEGDLCYFAAAGAISQFGLWYLGGRRVRYDCACQALYCCPQGCRIPGSLLLQILPIDLEDVASTEQFVSEFNSKFEHHGLKLLSDGTCSCSLEDDYWSDEEDDDDFDVDNGAEEAQALRNNADMHALNGNRKGNKGGAKQPSKQPKEQPKKAEIIKTSRARAQTVRQSEQKQAPRPKPTKLADESDIVAAHFARNMAPSTLALMEQVLDPDGAPNQTGDPRLYHVEDPVPIPLKSPARCLTYPVMAASTHVIPPGAFVLIQSALNVRSTFGSPEDALSVSQSSPQIVCIIENPAAALTYWNDNLDTIEPYLYNVESGIGVDTNNIAANRLSVGALNDGRVVAGGVDNAHVAGLFAAGGFSGGMVAAKRTPFPDTKPLSLACAGGYQRCYVTFSNQLDSLRYHQLICRRGRIPPGTQASESLTVNRGTDQYVCVADGNQFFFPSAFAHFCQGAGQPAAQMPGFNNVDQTLPLTGQWLVPTALALKTLAHAVSGVSVFELFQDELFPCSTAPYKTGTLVGSMDKECGWKARFPVFDSGSNGGLTEFGDYNEVIGSYYSDTLDLVPEFTPATSIGSETGAVILSYFVNTTSNNITIDPSTVWYGTGIFSSDMEVEFSPPFDPYTDSAISLLATHPVFSTPDSFWNWIKKAAGKVWKGVKTVGKAAGSAVLEALPALATGAATGNPAIAGSALHSIAQNTLNNLT